MPCWRARTLLLLATAPWAAAVPTVAPGHATDDGIPVPEGWRVVAYTNAAAHVPAPAPQSAAAGAAPPTSPPTTALGAAALAPPAAAAEAPRPANSQPFVAEQTTAAPREPLPAKAQHSSVQRQSSMPAALTTTAAPAPFEEAVPSKSVIETVLAHQFAIGSARPATAGAPAQAASIAAPRRSVIAAAPTQEHHLSASPLPAPSLTKGRATQNISDPVNHNTAAMATAEPVVPAGATEPRTPPPLGEVLGDDDLPPEVTLAMPEQSGETVAPVPAEVLKDVASVDCLSMMLRQLGRGCAPTQDAKKAHLRATQPTLPKRELNVATTGIRARQGRRAHKATVYHLKVKKAQKLRQQS
mmetsp:Transcript_9428/g.24423  ORF Transcript_9428/g.24423 Transcript_9428/m.24423 type:complete len:356 (-) Transcript_9428:29-1096(-)